MLYVNTPFDIANKSISLIVFKLLFDVPSLPKETAAVSLSYETIPAAGAAAQLLSANTVHDSNQTAHS